MSTKTYFHSVRLDKNKCKGCTTCLKRCPTEAIRIRDNRARILDERCIDCGECIRVCPHHAKIAKTDSLESALSRFPYKIALPAPTLYAQFKGINSVVPVIAGLFALGFDDVFEVARAAELISYATAQILKTTTKPKPVISSACPAIVRLIQVRFPALIDNVMDLLSPMDAAADIAKEEFCKRHGVSREEVGVFFITPCPAKMTAIKAPIGQEKSNVDGAVSVVEIYGLLAGDLGKKITQHDIDRASAAGVGWAVEGGEIAAAGVENSIAVDGIANVIRALEAIENNRLSGLNFFEGLACTDGCLGGPLTFDNSFVAKNRMRRLMKGLPKSPAPSEYFEQAAQRFAMTKPIEPRDIAPFSGTLQERLGQMGRVEQILATLPGLDCGSCGSPTCRTLAEDVVRGYATELNCIFKLRERVQFLAEQMVQINKSTTFYSDARKERQENDENQ